MLRPVGAVPFVGRERELALLERQAGRARQGEPGVVLVEAGPGFGKSALLGRFLAGLGQALVLRASGEEAEVPLAYGVVAQLLASVRAGARAQVALPAAAPRADPLTVGAGLVTLFGQLQGESSLLVVAVDDAQWADSRSAAALLFALRRMQGDRVLAVVTARPGELAGMGDAWHRFISGDYRASRIRLAGLDAGEIAALGRALQATELSRRAAERLRDHTGGSPLYCRVLLEEAGPEELSRWEQPSSELPTPPALAAMLLGRMRKLSQPARELLQAAAVLGRSASLPAAASLAGPAEPLTALDEAVSAGLIREETRADGATVVFAHPLVHRAVYDSLGPLTRRRLHERAGGLVGRDEALAHRFAAAVGPAPALAADLAAAAGQASAAGRLTQAASWLAQAAAVTASAADRDRLLLDALEALMHCGDAAGAQALAARVTSLPPGPRRSALLGHLDLLAGRVQSAEARLRQAWQDHDPVAEPLVGAQAALQLVFCSALAGRPGESITWGERAVEAAAGDDTLRPHALGALAVAMAGGHDGEGALSRLAFLPTAPAEVPATLTDVLVNRGMVRVMTEDLAGAIADLSAAFDRLRAGTPLRYAGHCLGYLAEAEYRLGNWDDAVVHSELAVSLARDADRRWDFSFVHAFAALVPAARGDWETAAGHVAEAGAAAAAAGCGMPVTAWATARAALATARGDHEEVLRAAATVRGTGRAHFFGSIGLYGWRTMEVAALIRTGDHKQAARVLSELRVSLTPASPPSLRMSAESLRGWLSAERGDAAAAAQAFAAAWRYARGLPLPFHICRLELADGHRLRLAGRRPEAIARLRSARGRLTSLGARPYLAVCDAELAACGVHVGGATAPETLGLTPSELAVAHLVARGRSNREAAAELYVSVKAIEFHLGNVFTKLGIRSRRELADRLAGPLAAQPGAAGPLSRMGA